MLEKEEGPLSFTQSLHHHPLTGISTAPRQLDLASFNTLFRQRGWGASFHQPWFCFTSGSLMGYFPNSKKVREQAKTPWVRDTLWTQWLQSSREMQELIPQDWLQMGNLGELCTSSRALEDSECKREVCHFLPTWDTSAPPSTADWTQDPTHSKRCPTAELVSAAPHLFIFKQKPSHSGFILSEPRFFW